MGAYYNNRNIASATVIADGEGYNKGLIEGQKIANDPVVDGSIVNFSNNRVKTIANNVFQYRDTLESASAANVELIEIEAFSHCYYLKNVNFPKATRLKDNAFFNAYSLTEANFPALVQIDNSVFQFDPNADTHFEEGETYEPKLIKISIPNCTTIGKNAFRDCTSLVTVENNGKLKTINNSAFYGCTALKDINLENVSLIDISAFYGCIGLTGDIYTRATQINENAFYGCSGITSIYAESLTGNIKSKAFYGCTGLTSFTGYGVNGSIEGDAFRECKNLVTLNTGTITSVAGAAFYNCSNFDNPWMLYSVSSIGGSAFFSCVKLGATNGGNLDLSICQTVGSNAFRNCVSLKSVYFGYNITKIDGDAFTNCVNLGSVDLRNANGIVTLGSNIFGGTATGASFVVPSEKLSTYKSTYPAYADRFVSWG